MKRFAAFLWLAGFSSAALAATPVTVQQVEQLLTSAHGQQDAKVAAKVAGLELVERASSATLARWEACFPGPRTHEALLALADSSAFLDPPAAEIPALAKPEPSARREILLRAVEYVNTTTHKMPNFSARRTTTHFDNVSPAQRQINLHIQNLEHGFDDETSVSQLPAPKGSQPLQAGEVSTALVTYRNGYEVTDSETAHGKAKKSLEIGLTTSGEFGPILSVVLGDAMNGEIVWDRWEQGKDGPLAVFRYAVPQQRSHDTLLGLGGKPHFPAYHGQIFVDPKNGAILRITLVSEPDDEARFESAILVEYGPVVIGNVPYICPIRGVAISRFPESTVPISPTHELEWRKAAEIKIPPQTFVNDVSFAEYHVFRADARILP